MSSIKHSTVSFLISGIFSKVLIPFLGLLYISFCLKDMLDFRALWILSSFSFLSFSLIQLGFLKDTRIRYSRNDLWALGGMWSLAALIIQAFIIHMPMHVLMHGPINWQESFCFCRPWLYIVLGLFLTPRLCGIYARQWTL
jgi:hypothetical protein